MKSPSFLWFLFKSLIAATLLVGLSVTHATTYDWFGATNADFSGTTTNWSLGAIPGINDIARWNAAIYTNAPTANANWTVGELLFDAGNTSGVSFDVGVATITLSGNATGSTGIGIQMNSGSGAVSTGSAKFALGGSQSWTNNSSNTLTVGGAITNSGNTTAFALTAGGTGNTIILGNISNGGTVGTTAMIKTGNGTLTLSGANTYTGGTTLSGGILTLSSAQALGGNGTVASVGTIKFTGGILQFSGNNTTDYSSRFSQSASQFFKLDTNGQNVTQASLLASIGGSFTKLGIGTLTVTTASSSYDGVTTISGGILNVKALAAVNTNSSIGKGSVGGSAADIVLDGGTLQYTGLVAQTTNRLFTVTANGGSIDASSSNTTNPLTFTGTGTMGASGTGARILTLTGSNAGANSIAGILVDSSNGSTGLVKSGMGKWVLAGANTYTGNTTIAGGTLALGSSGSIGSSSGIAVASGATFDVSAVLGGYSLGVSGAQTLSGGGTVNGAVTIGANGTLSPGNSPGVLTFNGNLALNSGSTTLMQIAGSTAGIGYDQILVSGQITFGGRLNIVSDASFHLDQAGSYHLFNFISKVGNFDFVTVSGTALVNAGGMWSGAMGGFDYTFAQGTGVLDVSPFTTIPEPATYAAIFGSLILAGVVIRRRRFQRGHGNRVVVSGDISR